MGRRWMCVGLVALLVAMSMARAWAQEEQEEVKTTGVKKYGFVHNIAEDRKLVKVGGLYEPEGLDLYMKRLFDGLETRIRKLEDKIDSLEKRVVAALAEKKKPEEKSA